MSWGTWWHFPSLPLSPGGEQVCAVKRLNYPRISGIQTEAPRRGPSTRDQRAGRGVRWAGVEVECKAVYECIFMCVCVWAHSWVEKLTMSKFKSFMALCVKTDLNQAMFDVREDTDH